MKRVLALLLSLAIVAAVAATPAVACAGTATLGSQHGCCGTQTVAAAPTGPCCFLSQPSERTVNESRILAAADRAADLLPAHSLAWFDLAERAARSRGSTLPPGPPPVPIYIQQLSLLI
jgi:hypothetical protein